MHWPQGVISNRTLYKRYKVVPLSERVAKSRWTMLGHILRSSEQTPASLSLQYAVEGAKIHKRRVGRPRLNLLNVIKEDLTARDLQLSNSDELKDLRALAADRKRWRELFFEVL